MRPAYDRYGRPAQRDGLAHELARAGAALVGAALVGFLATFAAAGDLRGAQLFNTGPFPCDGSSRTALWTNPGPDTYYVKGAQLWHGVDRDQYADVVSWAARTSDGTLLMTFAQDRYSNPGGLTQATRTFAPDYVRIVPGDSIYYLISCVPASPGVFNTHGAAELWGTLSEP